MRTTVAERIVTYRLRRVGRIQRLHVERAERRIIERCSRIRAKKAYWHCTYYEYAATKRGKIAAVKAVYEYWGCQHGECRYVPYGEFKETLERVFNRSLTDQQVAVLTKMAQLVLCSNPYDSNALSVKRFV